MFFAKYFLDIYSEYIYHTVHDNDLCHVRRSMGNASAATHPTLGGYSHVQMSG
jgi:hypothetical protein